MDYNYITKIRTIFETTKYFTKKNNIYYFKNENN